MINLEDLKRLKEENEKNIIENNNMICEKQKENLELEAENRVFDKLILVEASKEEKCCCESQENEMNEIV